MKSDPDLNWIPDWKEEVERLKDFKESTRNPLFQQHIIISRSNTDYKFKAFIDNKHNILSKISEINLL
ncbi:hypothetical protein CON11_26695 [Priestia megaterium]|uniref:hypothetical protein n=1 Tax=Priestia megaterium TaxID=1404 RepID=UPI000BEBACD0|nr:hypothetical protein [Priestia megaterium]PEC41744.1 hypothetical protein CON11_26695 [Priestia megaterium]